MASIIPKLKLFLFISFISLLINISVCCVAYIDSEQDINDYAVFHDEEIKIGQVEQTANITATNFVMATATSFVPFVDIINLAFLGLDTITLLIVGIVTTLFGVLKLLLLAEMVLGHVPFVDV